MGNICQFNSYTVLYIFCKHFRDAISCICVFLYLHLCICVFETWEHPFGLGWAMQTIFDANQMRINHIKSKNQCIFIHFWPFFTRFGLYFQFPGPRWLIYNNLPIWRIYLFHFLTFDKCGWDIYPYPQPHISAYAHHPPETVFIRQALNLDILETRYFQNFICTLLKFVNSHGPWPSVIPKKTFCTV